VRPPHHHVVPPLATRGRLALTEPELAAWGERFGRAARAPLVVGLTGELGAGKTTLVRAICRGYGVEGEVTSPTYALVHEYESPRSVVRHLDLYRLESERDLANIGWDDVLSNDALVLVEWPERAGRAMPDDAVSLELEHIPGDPDRRLLLAG
jgi:tRNA threonylcarbamoyladenosine biosynthesis protein TsaE